MCAKIVLQPPDSRLETAVRTVLDEYKTEAGSLTCVQSPMRGFELHRGADGVRITYGDRHQLFHALSYLATDDAAHIVIEPKAAHMGVMVDCSRNAVMRPDRVKQLIRFMALTGYDYLQLYTEDTLEMEGEPYFGYLRGAYTAAEIRDLDAYAALFGIELMPCIQTLAHLATVNKWPVYADLFDVEGVLLIDEPKTYEFIEKRIRTVSEMFTSRNVHIGMDEAFLVGFGRYFERHGYTDRYEMLFRHLDRVLRLCEKYGLSARMWSDMFFMLGFHGYYQDEKRVFDDSVRAKVPPDVRLVYWDYWHDDAGTYDRMLDMHRQLTDKVSFAGGIHTWKGFVPDNHKSHRTLTAAMGVCGEKGIDDILVTSWGDNGGECGVFSALSGLILAGWHNCHDAADGERIDARARFLTGYGYDELLYLDEPDRPLLKAEKQTTASKSLLYNDPMLGLFDCHMTDKYPAFYRQTAERMRTLAARPSAYNYLFDLYGKLCEAVAEKCEVSLRLKAVYEADDRPALRQIVQTALPRIVSALNEFHAASRAEWLSRNKPFGFEILDIRMGGLLERVRYAGIRLADYLDGKTERLEELEAVRLPYNPVDDPEEPSTYQHIWARGVSNGVI